MSLIGAVYGTLVVQTGRTWFSEEYPAMWYFLMGSVFIVVTRYFPTGLAGIYDDYLVPFGKRLARRGKRRPAKMVGSFETAVQGISTVNSAGN